MEPGAEISELCRQEGISPTQFYMWKKKLADSAESAFGRENAKANAAPVIDPKEQELQGLRSVIADITAENLELKRTL